MTKAQKIARLVALIAGAGPLMGVAGRIRDPAFVKWAADVRAFLERTAPQRLAAFNGQRFTVTFLSQDQRVHLEAFNNGLRGAVALLESVKEELILYDDEGGASSEASAPTRVLEMCRRFPRAARQLQKRHAKRPGIEQNDEYDVQDVLHAFLLLHFDDVRTEEWTPSYGGPSARIDFVLPAERIAIEVKRTRDGLGSKQCKEQLAIDIDHYRIQKDCGTLVCFVFDPELRITNPPGFEKDLDGQRTDTLSVRVVVAPHP